MVPLALRTLLHDKIRLLIAVGGVSFAILLMLVLRGIMDGTVAKATTYVDHVGADIFVAQEGVGHFALATSVLPRQTEAAASGVPGVALARGIVSVPMVVAIAGGETAVRLVGFDTSTGLGGPWALSQGTADVGSDGVVIDATLAQDRNLHVGDTLELSGVQFTIRGLSRQTNALAGKVIFVSRDVASQLIGLRDAYSYILVQTEQGADVRAVAQASRGLMPHTTVMTRAELSNAERDLLSSLFITPVNVMATIGLLVGIMVVGLTIYTAAAERLKDYGVLKAIGASNGYIYGVVIRQSLLLGMVGFVLGLGAGYVVKPIVEHYVPDMGIDYRPAFVAVVLSISIGMSLLSAILPVYRIAGVDPKQVFGT